MTVLSIEPGPPLDEDPNIVGHSMTLGRFLNEIAERSGEHEAVVTIDQRLSYVDLRDRAMVIARALVARGIGKSSRVAIMMPNCPDWVAAFLATTSIGAVAVTINTFAPDDDVEYMLATSDTEVLLTDSSIMARLEAGQLVKRHPLLSPGATDGRDLALPALRSAFLLDDDQLAKSSAGVHPDLVRALTDQVMPDDDALVMFTSGSTGRSKAVLHSNRAICIQCWRWAATEAHRPTDRIWTTAPFFWSSGLVRSLGSALAAGATLVLQPHFEAGAALELLERERVTTVLSRPHLDYRMLEHPEFAQRDLTRIVKITEQSPLRNHLLGEAPGTRVGAFGMTETMTILSYGTASEPGGDPAHGHVLPGLTVRIADPDTGVTVDRGAVGRICVRGATVMRGYCKSDRRDTFDDDGYFATSDAGFIDENGRLHWTARLDNVIKVAGVNVSPTDVERQLAGWEALVAYSVFAVPHPTLGAALVLCVSVGRGTGVDESAIRQFLSERLASYQMPRQIVIVDVDEVPYTSTLKVNVKALQTLAFRRVLGQVDGEWAAHIEVLQQSGELPGLA